MSQSDFGKKEKKLHPPAANATRGGLMEINAATNKGFSEANTYRSAVPNKQIFGPE